MGKNLKIDRHLTILHFGFRLTSNIGWTPESSVVVPHCPCGDSVYFVLFIFLTQLFHHPTGCDIAYIVLLFDNGSPSYWRWRKFYILFSVRFQIVFRTIVDTLIVLFAGLFFKFGLSLSFTGFVSYWLRSDSWWTSIIGLVNLKLSRSGIIT